MTTATAGMEYLVLSDLTAGVAMAASTVVHAQKGAGKAAAYSVLSSVAGRWVSYWLSGGSVDSWTGRLLTPQLKNYVVVGLCRYAIAMAMKEPNAIVKSYDTVVNDLLGVEVLNALGIADRGLLGSGAVAGTTNPAAATGAASGAAVNR